MQLLLTVRKNNGSEQQSYSHCFDETGGTIGRSQRNDWTLVDPDRYVSERHARIKFRNGAFELTDLSTNGTYLNDGRRRIPRHGSVILDSGDELSMGNLQIEVKILGQPDRSHELPDPGRESGHESRDGDTVPLDQLQDWARESAEEDGPSASSAQPDSPEIPEEWRSLIAGFFEPVAERSGTPKRPEEHDKSATNAPTGDAAAHAMLQELGIEDLSNELPPEDLGREVGRILRLVAGGLMEALKARAEVKNRFRIQSTRMRSVGNNPLKSSETLESALRRVLRDDKDAVYLKGAPAFREAFDDLRIHELAMLNAVHASIEAVIADFDPRPLKEKLKKIAPVSAATPVLGSAKSWNLYEEHYQEIAAQLRDDARLGFLKEFAKAYENATEKLRTNPKPDKNDPD